MMLYNYYCGNPIKYKGDTMVWLCGRMLYAYTKGETTCSFNYDVNGIRRRKSTTAGKTEYLISDGKLIGQNYYASGASEPSKKITFVYTHNGLTGCVIDKMTYVYHKDVFGNVVALISGVMPVAYYQYDAWGNCKVLNPNGTENTDPNFAGNVNPIRYRSYYYDADIGLYYLQTRYYDPETGRFINLDQIEYLAPEQLNGLNLYAYCLNNPVMGYDPEGTSLILLAGILLGAVFGAVEGLISAKTNDRDIGWGMALGALGGAFMGLITGGTNLLLGTEAIAGQLMIIGMSSLVTGMSTEALNQVVNKEPIKAENVISSGISSMLVYSLSYGFSLGLPGEYLDTVSRTAITMGTTMIFEPLMILLGLPSKYYNTARTK